MHPIGAWFTRTGLRRATQNKRTIYQQGRSSGFTSGRIININDGARGENCVRLGSGGGSTKYGVRSTANIAPRDSGGPMFAPGNPHPDPSYVVMVGHTALADNKQEAEETGCNGANYYGQSIAMGFYQLNNAFGIQFVTR